MAFLAASIFTMVSAILCCCALNGQHTGQPQFVRLALQGTKWSQSWLPFRRSSLTKRGIVAQTVVVHQIAERETVAEQHGLAGGVVHQPSDTLQSRAAAAFPDRHAALAAEASLLARRRAPASASVMAPTEGLRRSSGRARHASSLFFFVLVRFTILMRFAFFAFVRFHLPTRNDFFAL